MELDDLALQVISSWCFEYMVPISDHLQQLAINITLRHVHEEDIIFHVIKGISHFAQTKETTSAQTTNFSR